MNKTGRKWMGFVILGLSLLALGIFVRDRLGIDLDPESIRQWVLSAGPIAPVLCVAMVAGRSVIGLPSQLVLIVAGLSFGIFWGTVYGALGLEISGLITFQLARVAGRESVHRKIPERLRPIIARAGERPGAVFIAVGTGYPIGVLTAYHALAGVTPMKFRVFAFALALGATARAATYAYFGNSLMAGELKLVVCPWPFPPAAHSSSGFCWVSRRPHPRRPKLLRLFPQKIQRRPCSEPRDLFLVQGVLHGKALLAAIDVSEHSGQGHLGPEFSQSVEADPIGLQHFLVIGGVGKGQRQNTLFFQIGFMNPRKASGDHRARSQVSGGHGGVFAATSLTVVLVADHDPARSLGLVVPGDGRETNPSLLGQLVEPRAWVSSECIDRADEHIVADVVEMATETQPWTRHGNMIRCALPPGLEEKRQALHVLSIPGREWGQFL